jgi:hypothetical protein
VTSSARTSITALPRGHEFAAATFTVSVDLMTQYLAAVGDEGDYGQSIPPLAAVALGLRALQDTLFLPEGSLHTGQEVEQESALRPSDLLTLTGRIAQRSERQGYVISVVEFEIAGEANVAIRARSTIMAPGGA